MTTTTKKWEMEYYDEEEWRIHRAGRATPYESADPEEIFFIEYMAEVCWRIKDGKPEYRYQLTKYEFNFGEAIDNENCYIDYMIRERRQYKSRNALMNALRRIK